MRLFLSLLLASGLLPAQDAIRGFSPSDIQQRKALETRLRRMPDPVRIGGYLKHMAAGPHHAGSPASKAVAEYALGLLKSWGYDARIEEFEALLPYPTRRSLEMTAPVPFKARLREPAVKEDPDSSDANQLPTYNAYSASGTVTAPLVYVNYGIPEDYETLAKLGIDVKGKIVIARYGRSWRGTKPKVAWEHGAAGCLIYSDPRDDGYFQGDAYPKGPMRPPAGVQRGSVMDMPLYTGDPLSPGWASEKGSKRLALAEAGTILKIPVLPISYEDAQPLLENLRGPLAPEAWRGALPITYHLGPGDATVRLSLDFDWTNKPLYNVIARLPGSVCPDQWVIYGNHHDAWVNGASDPVSGAAALLETARAFGELYRTGWRPRRTLVFALWDGEEFGLVGSTEWLEKHQDELSSKAVAYFNSDSNGKGTLSVGGTPVLEQFATEIARDNVDPVSGETLLSKARARRGRNEARTSDEPPGFHLGPLGAGSDYVAFIHHAGISSLNLGFSGEGGGGVYHSIYDSVAWYTKFSDGEFLYGRALAQVMGTALVRLADATVLPFEFGAMPPAVRRCLDSIAKDAGKNASKLDFKPVRQELDRLEQASAAFERQLEGVLAHAPADGAALVTLNEDLFRAERALAESPGLPGRGWYRYRLSAPGVYTGYGAKTLPGVREAAEAQRWDEAGAEVRALAEALARFRGRVERATEDAKAVAR